MFVRKKYMHDLINVGMLTIKTYKGFFKQSKLIIFH
jgi:hypothetical protein